MVKKASPEQAKPTEQQEYAPDHDDPVSDVLQRVRRMAAANDGKFNDDDLREVERQARDRWGGDKVYIGRKLEDSRSERNQRIRADFYQRGERIPYLMRKYGLSRWQIGRVLNQPL